MTKFGRRRLLKTGAIAGVLAATGLPAAARPRRGGTLRLGLGGALTTDTWDSRTHDGAFMGALAHGAVFDCLTEVTASGQLTGELAESWEASPDARVWTFTLRRGISFHNGRPFGARDVIASLRLHQDAFGVSPAKALVAGIARMARLSDHQMRITLGAPNPDFPFLMADRHLVIYPADDIADAMAQGIGTGLYRVHSLDPGRRAVLTRVQSHYKDGKAGWFERVEATAMNDPAQRADALVKGRIDAAGGLDPADAAKLQARGRQRVIAAPGNQHITLALRADHPDLSRAPVRAALRHAIDRDALLDQALHGLGRVAYDHPIGPANQFFADDVAVTPYDPACARALLTQAGIDSLHLDLALDPGTVPGAQALARQIAASALPAGITITPVTGPTPNAALRLGRSTGRATEDWMFSVSLGGHWARADLTALAAQGRAEFDSHRRRQIYGQMQQAMALDGTTLVPVYAHLLDGAAPELAQGASIGNLDNLDSGRVCERWWFA